LETLLKKEGLKGKKSGKTLNYEKTVFPTISTDYINLNIAFEVASKDKNAPVTTVFCFVSKGVANEFVTSSADPQLISNLKAFLDTKYATTVYDNDVAIKKLAKEKEIKATEDDLKSLDKTIEKRTKDISGYEKDIKKANDNITKAKSDIETAKKSIITQKSLLQKQQDELKQIK
jgi:peptidoglycan hydrolase CwlO-like protein